MKFVMLLNAFLIIFIIPALSQTDSIPSFPVNEIQSDNTGLFDSDSMLEVALKFDITEYKKRKDDSTYMDAWLSTAVNGDTITRKIKLRARGEFRRKFCDMPPIMLNLDMDDSIQGYFRNINKLKMVTVCPAGNQEYLLKEYLTYKLYSVLTDVSYKVRLLKVNYINSNKQNKGTSDFAFVIEPDDLLAKRTEAVEVTTANLTQKNVKPEMMDRMAVFNYMIGNTDWSVPIGHNTKLFAQYYSERPDLAAVVPFDFDFSGIVNTDYAAPFHTLSLGSVRERKYLGMCRDKETFLKVLSEFNSKKREFYKVISEFSLLDERSKNDMIYYLDTFYEDLIKPEALARTLLRECIRF
jgi:hypothetical protein